MTIDGQADYDIGYRKPPRQRQFRKGQSGNPNGRAKGSKSLAALIKSALNETVAVTQNGQRKKITKLEAMTTQLANKGASGDPKATQLLLGMIQLFEARADTPGQTPMLADADRKVMEQLFGRIQRMQNRDSDENADTK
jgi:hypothetical protein